MDYKQLAIRVATDAHEGDTRWDKKTPYITHPLKVAQSFQGEDEVFEFCIAVLHDVVEDTDITQEFIDNSFPFEISSGVDAMTRRDNETYLQSIIRVKQHPRGRKVKIADIRHNASDGVKAKSSAANKYSLALYILSDGAIIE